MLFTEQDLNYTNVFSLLENANYLDESESLINPKTIPVKEVSRLGYGVVRFDDVDRLAESHGIDYIDAMYAIAEASEMNPEYLAVAVPEEDIIAYPEIVNELANIVIAPLSEDSFAYQYVDICLEAWDNTGDDGYLGAIVDDSCLDEAAELLFESIGGKLTRARRTVQVGIEKGKRAIGSRINDIDLVSDYDTARQAGQTKFQALKTTARLNKGQAAAAGIGTAAAVGAGAYGVYKFANWVKEANNKPKSWIGKKIAALRSIYQKWMQQAQSNPQKAGAIKSAAAKLLSIIDALMAKLQRAAG